MIVKFEKNFRYYDFFSILYIKTKLRNIRCIEVNIRVSVCLLSYSFNFTGTLIFISAVTGAGALATAFF